ncbi:hypothetical protein A2995_02025 [Candidatus Nomurabacteria bacterium RIFCSPLOWO2_01_FULL_33_24]|uniref:Primosomal protein N' 3' DNA-binding domain-containing protein n=1 Tax=Candidatus Nomurabacteria bacterium RIFCSPLOWO2_01_FULL_33_24 TaxID=1801765 RepID=A0A1F6WZ73_9BACT|nr:MAG: hypothetical protein A2995_02025 [Candidatus Nomurabacteria bacterium RIFCSPLOWO2_01_FULL_33_24]
MKIINVIPITKNIYKENLTYFSANDIPIGAIVSVPIRKKFVDALVISTNDLIKEKTSVKLSAFNLRKVQAIKGPAFFSPEFLKTCLEISRYFVSSPGIIINSLLPKKILNEYKKIKVGGDLFVLNDDNLTPEKLIFQAPIGDRLDYYKLLIRQSFAKKQSIFLCLPTIQDIEIFTELLQGGIQKYVFSLHGNLTTKQQIEICNNIINEKHPILIIATGLFFFLPRKDIGLYIVEKESSGTYKLLNKSGLDIRVFAELLANKTKTKIIFGDTFLCSETIWRYKKKQLAEVINPSFRILPGINKKIIDIKKDKKFKIISDFTEKIISKNIKENKKIFLFVLRKGLAPVTVCNDCGLTLSCSSCNSPLVLFQSVKNQRLFICNKCKKEENANIKCKNCQGWNLVPLGIGIDGVVSELKEKFPEIAIYQIDKEKIKTRKQGLTTIRDFYKDSKGILVGTEMALSFFQEKIDQAIIISFDSLFGLPSFKINEKIIYLTNTIGTYLKKDLFIQTGNPKNKTLRAIVSGNLINFYNDELMERKKFNYPPFSTLIKLTHFGKKTDIKWIKEEMEEILNDYHPEIYRAFVSKIKNLYKTNIIFRVKREEWSLPTLFPKSSLNEDLFKKLYDLPLYWNIQVDPDNLL